MNKREKITAVRVLRGAAKLLKEVGWCQRRAMKVDLSGEPIAYCMLGALQEQKANSGLAQEAVKEYLALESFVSIPAWNDKKSRKKREVLDARALHLAERGLQQRRLVQASLSPRLLLFQHR